MFVILLRTFQKQISNISKDFEKSHFLFFVYVYPLTYILCILSLSYFYLRHKTIMSAHVSTFCFYFAAKYTMMVI